MDPIEDAINVLTDIVLDPDIVLSVEDAEVLDQAIGSLHNYLPAEEVDRLLPIG